MKKILLLAIASVCLATLSFGQNLSDVNLDSENCEVQSENTVRIYVRNWDAEGRIKAFTQFTLSYPVYIEGYAKTLVLCGDSQTPTGEYEDGFRFVIEAGTASNYEDLPYMCDNPQRITGFYFVNLSKHPNDPTNYELIY